MQLIWGAAEADKEAILKYGIEVGFMTGEENRQLINAHTAFTLTIGAPFRSTLYDFGEAGFTEKLFKCLPAIT